MPDEPVTPDAPTDRIDPDEAAKRLGYSEAERSRLAADRAESNPPIPTPEQAAAIAAEDPVATITRLEADLKAARNEAGKARVNAKAAAADEARAELAKQVGKALGLVEDDAADPAKLAEQVSTFQADAKAAKVELAVYRAATTANADPAALLDSRAFLAKVAELDPTNSDALVAAIAEAVAENPRLGKTEPIQPGMKPNRAQGSSSQPPLGLDAQIAAAEQAGDTKTSLRLKAAKTLSQ